VAAYATATPDPNEFPPQPLESHAADGSGGIPEDIMSREDQTTEESRAGDGVDVNVTEARAGVRRGMWKVLLISTVLAILALAAAWMLVPR
jgi:hypothetical protein